MAGKTIVLVALALTVTGYASEETAPKLRLPSGLEAIATAAQLGQPWPGSPQARADDGWFVVLGTRLTGTQVDLLRDGPVNWARPSGSLYLDDRYARYMMWLLDPTMAAYRPYYAGSFCQRYNSRVRGPTAKLGKVRVYYMRAGNGGGPTKSFLLEYSCPK
jgi:hypothetical protein